MTQNITPVNRNSEIMAQDFNTIESAVSDLIRGYYGYQGANSLPVIAKSNVISANQVDGVINDINRCSMHQSNTTSGLVLVGTGTQISSTYFGSIALAANSVINNPTQVNPAQLSPDTTNATSSRTTVWGSTITHTVIYSWNDVQAQYFFNLGGYIQPSIRVSSTGSNSAIDQTWIRLINQAAQIMSTSTYTRTDFISTGSNIKSVVSLSSGTNTINAQFTHLSTSTVKYTLTMTPQIFSSVDITVSSTVTNYYSRGDLGGIAAPRPAVSSIDFFGTAGNVIPHLKTLAVTLSTSTFVTSAGGDPTNSAVMTLTNNGNTAVTITSFSYINGDPSLTPQPDQIIRFPLVILPNTSQTMVLSYLAAKQGNFNSSLSILSDNDQGTLTLKINQNITAPIFILSLAPSVVNTTIRQPYQVPQKFTIVARGGILKSYTASMQPSTGFSLNALNVDGPMVTFDPAAVGLVAGTYSTVVSVTAISTYGVTASTSAVVTYNYSPVVTQNLGSWLSPLDANNAVAGFSYDIIDNQRYLTAGFGVGGDGATAVVNYTTPGAYAYTVPDGITKMDVVIRGGAGGGGGCDDGNGHAGYNSDGAIGYINVTPGQTYTILVGGGGAGGVGDQGGAPGGSGGTTGPYDIMLNNSPNVVLHGRGDYSDGPTNSSIFRVTNTSATPLAVNVSMTFFYGSHVRTYSRIYRSDGTKLYDTGLVDWNFNVVYHSTQYLTFTVSDTIPANTTYGYYAQMQTSANGDYDYSVGPNGLYSIVVQQPTIGAFDGGSGSAAGPVPVSGGGGGGGAASAILLNGNPVVVVAGGGGGGGGGWHSPGLDQQGRFSGGTHGANGTYKGGDGGGAGGGGGGYPHGGAGGDVQGGDDGGYSGTSGQSLIPGTMAAIHGASGGHPGIRGVQNSTPGQDGSVSIILPWASTDNLGVVADRGYNQSTALYACQQLPSYGALLQSYGAWINATGLPMDQDITRTYTVVLPDTGIYDWAFAVNSSGYFSIDGVRIGDLSNLTVTNYTQGISGSVALTAGSHILSFGVNNSSSFGSANVGAVALTLSSRSTKQMVWCTLYPIRLAAPYKYWQEVARIPLLEDGVQHIYQSHNYLIKDTLPVSDQHRWGDYFGSSAATGSMFTIKDDGYGNLTITFNAKTSNTGVAYTQQTVNNVQYLPYYYSTAENRYANLQGLINGNQTQYFLGFSRSGTTVTSIVKAP